jgi:hypothetical protein
MWVGIGLFFGEKTRDILSCATFYLAGSTPKNRTSKIRSAEVLTRKH